MQELSRYFRRSTAITYPYMVYDRNGNAFTRSKVSTIFTKPYTTDVGLCVAMDQKLTLSNLLSRMPLICGESFNSVAKELLLLFVPKAHEMGVFGTLILARVLEHILS
jgi:hypothetical protein